MLLIACTLIVYTVDANIKHIYCISYIDVKFLFSKASIKD